MSSHSNDTSCELSFEMADQRRFTLCVLVDDARFAQRLAGYLAWRGYAFDRVVIKPAEIGQDSARLTIVTTETNAAVDRLQDVIKAYGPVKAVRQLYTAPVMAPRSAPPPSVTKPSRRVAKAQVERLLEEAV